MSRGAKTSIILFLIICLILFTGAFTALPVDAFEVEEGIEPEEDETIMETESESSDLAEFTSGPSILEEDPDPGAFIKQIGDGNIASIEQIGEGNYAEIEQIGYNNIGEIIQEGNDNEAYLYQGDESELVENTYGFIKQVGDDNDATMELTEDGEKDEIIQNGNNNTASTGIFGSGSVSIEQNGDNMNLSVDALFTN